MKDEKRAPFYKELYNKLENEIGTIDMIIGLGIGVVACGLYWRHAWKNH